jgi:signal peptidase II
MRPTKTFAFWPVLLGLLAVDCATKEMAVNNLTPPHVAHPVVGDFIRFTLTYNPDAAMGLSLGQYSRVAFGVIAAVMLGVLGFYYRRISGGDRLTVFALALIGGGAAGNMLDRVRSARGVVDFIDVGFGTARFYTFNIADAGVSLGTVLLLLVMLRSRSSKNFFLQSPPP